ncbi:MAG: hypothetical protein OEZ01_13960 [Candidatus Heimdallarchaeota archaeon]|nr:hypothetical protein [Candidatus Heimdallarchaeota archaeon]
MSGNGRLQALLEARRREKIRLENVKNQCRGIILALEAEIINLNSSIQQSMGSQLQNMKLKINNYKNELENSPDQTLININEIKERFVGIVTEGKNKSKEWDNYRIKWEEALLNAIIQVESLSNSQFKLGKENYIALVDELNQLRDSGVEATDIIKFDQINDKVNQVITQIEKDNVTREIIISIQKILKEKGFKPSSPKYSLSKQGTIEMVGMLSPGRNARFWISTEGQIEFNFEGYSGTTCKDTIDDIVLQLSNKEDIQSKIEQFEWHNPDKIEKGAKNYPIGGQVRSKGL